MNKRPPGRPKGAKNVASALREVQIAKTGPTPLSYMIAVLQDEKCSTARRDWAAEKAAPFVHPKFANIEANVAARITWRDLLKAVDADAED